MSISTLILLASLGPSKSLPVAGGGEQVVHYSAAPTQGDLVRQGLHPLVVLIRSDRHKAATIEGLYHGLGIGGFHRLALALPLMHRALVSASRRRCAMRSNSQRLIRSEST